MSRIRWQVQPHRRAAYSTVVGLVVASLAVVVLYDFRVGGYCLALTLGLAALLRAVLPAQWCLGLLIRSRRIDVAMLGGAALVLVFVVSRVRGTL